MDFDKDVHASAAYEAIQQAIALNSHAPANEQEYVAALARRCSADPRADEKKLLLDYKNATEQGAAHYPDDTDAGTLYAESWMDLDRFDWYDSGNPKPGTEEIALLLESVFRREPEHPEANHLYVHLMDDSLHPERALTSAYRLAQIAPGAGHLMHMGGHIFWKFGDYETAAHANERAVQVDAEYVRLTGVTDSVYAQGYYSHNMHFVSRSNAELMQDDPPAWDFPVRESLAAALLRSGRAAAAEAMFREDLQHNPRNPRGLFGLWHSLEAQHKTVAAFWVQRQFEDAWKNADSQLRIEDF